MQRLCFLLILLLSACATGGSGTTAYDLPIPAALPDGARGYAITGFAQFTSSEEEAKARVTKKMQDACSGPITYRRLDIRRADSLAGVRAIAFTPEG